MREKQAEQKGYSFTGHYGRDKEEIKEKAKELRQRGYRAVVCDVPHSPLSRSGRGTGYSIYAETKYFIDKEIADLTKKLSQIDSRKEYYLQKYNEQIQEIEEDKIRMENRLKEITSI